MTSRIGSTFLLALVLHLVPGHLAHAAEAAKDASPATQAANQAVLEQLPFANQTDFELAKRGFIATLEDPVIKGEKGNVVWDLTKFKFLAEAGDSPPSVNPSLWRQEKLLAVTGLFKVVDGIHQIRGLDIGNMTLVDTNTGWIVIDPLTVEETARAGFALARKHLGNKAVKAVIYTHSHVDHFGGVKGVVDEKDVKSGKVPIIAPVGFLEHAVSENVYAGNAMGRRATYMYSPLIPWGPKGSVGAGLGLTTPPGSVTLIAPTRTITKTGEKMTIDGLDIEFLNAPGSEAPAEMMFYLPKYKAFQAAEDLTHTLHNLYTLRGAQVRDALLWSSYIDQAIQMFGDKTEVVLASHHWPTWGKDQIVPYMKKQRDLYKYLNDQTLRLANQGYTMIEIAEMLELPPELANEFYDRSYYGTVNHNAKAVYQRYLGWFDGNPSNLHALPPAEAGKKYVEYMGGSAKVLENAKKDFAAGNYRWVAQALNHVVFAEPENQDAKNLLADALEQMGYQAESGPWRGFYLTGAMELRNGVDTKLPAARSLSPDLLRAMPTGMYLDYLAVRMDATKAAGKKLVLDLDFTEPKEQFRVDVENGVLHYAKGGGAGAPDAALTLTRTALDEITLGQASLDQQAAAGKIKVAGKKEAVSDFLALLDRPLFWFNIVTP